MAVGLSDVPGCGDSLLLTDETCCTALRPKSTDLAFLEWNLARSTPRQNDMCRGWAWHMLAALIAQLREIETIE
jgi:hypothetical protein